ncbi:hypothetical protein ACFYXM_07040 [Streptomyces sp. NPDC002476]|uniref:hypothetical protein n=1 Tax=Streptomyces sp. NPDC002476 TaxID=3364648 RepID=UPI003681B0AD
MRTYLSKTLSMVVPVLLAVLVPLSALSAWVDLEIDDTDRYVAAVAPLASDPEVRTTVADQITDATMQQIDAGPLQDVVRNFLHRAVLSFTTTDAFQDAWNAANRTAHEAVTAALNGNAGEAVTIDLAPVTERVKEDLKANGIPFADRIPVQHTEITLISAERADQLRQTFRLLRAGSVLPAVGTVVFAVLTVVVAGIAARTRAGRPGGEHGAAGTGNTRDRTSVTGTAGAAGRTSARGAAGTEAALAATALVGLGFALGALVLRVVVAIARNRVLAGVPTGQTGGAAAVYDALTGSLRTTAWTVLGAGLAVALCAMLARRGGVPAGAWRARRASEDGPGHSGSRDCRIGDD